MLLFEAKVEDVCDNANQADFTACWAKAVEESSSENEVLSGTDLPAARADSEIVDS